MFTSSTTVGESSLAGRPPSRGCLWARAVLLPLFLLAMAMGILYAVYRLDTVRVTNDPWRLLLLLPWVPYLVLGDVMVSYVDLFLPLAPLGLRNSLIAVACAGCGPLMLIGLAVYLYGHAWAAIAFACVFAVALAGLLATWIWLHRTYRASSS